MPSPMRCCVLNDCWVTDMSETSQNEVRMWLLEMLGKSIRLSAQLRSLLEAERDAMEAQDTEALHETLEAKRVCVDELKVLEESRIACCERAGFKYSPKQMDEVCNWCDKNSLVSNSWAELLDIIASCQKLNDTIAAIIHARRSQISKGLAVLCGSNTNPGTYGPNGSDVSGASQRDLAEA